MGCSFFSPQCRLDYGGWLRAVQPIWGAEAQGLAHVGDEFRSAVCWCVCQHSLFLPSAFLRLTSLFSPSSWILPFLFFILFSDYYQMLAACPALCAAITAPVSLGIPWFPSGRLLMLVCIFVFKPQCCLYPCPPESCLLPSDVPLPPPNPCHCCHLLAVPAPAVLCAEQVPCKPYLSSREVVLTPGTQWAWLVALQLCSLSLQCCKTHS